MARRTKGEGSLGQLGDGRWQARVTIREGGRTKRRAFYGKTQAEARRKLTAAVKGHDDGLPLPSERQTVRTFLKQWLVTKEADLRSETYRRYREACDLHIIPVIGSKPLPKLTPADVQECYAHCRAKGLSGTTVHHVHGVLRKALSDAERWGQVSRNVARLVDTPRRSTKEMISLTAEEAKRLLVAAQGDDLESFYIVALTTGLRLGELQALCWREVDLDGRRLRVVATLAGVKDGKPILASPKTARSRREVTLSAAAVEALRAHRSRQLEHRLKVGQHWQDNDLVFVNAFGRPLDGNNVRERSFAKLLTRAKLPPMRFHNLRHAAASLLMAEGVPIKVISEVLGHADITVTLKIYAHLMPAAQEQAASAMDRLFGHR